MGSVNIMGNTKTLNILKGKDKIKSDTCSCKITSRADNGTGCTKVE